MFYYILKNKIINVILISNEKGIQKISFPPFVIDASWKKNKKIHQPIINQLEKFFDGKIKEFDINLSLEGTDFQKKVWSEIKQIPYGETITYKELAENIGVQKAYQAIGTTCGKNPLPIIIPCHRVIGSNNQLKGYSGGIEAKKRLLTLELQHI